jgi:hypothetical protein
MATIWKYDVGASGGKVFATGVPTESVHRLMNTLSDFYKGLSSFSYTDGDVAVQEPVEEPPCGSEIVALAREAREVGWTAVEREMRLGDYWIRERIER